MFQLINLRKIAIALAMFALVGLGSVSVARADNFSFTAGSGNTLQNVSGTIVGGNGTVTITITNLLTNAQVNGVIQNVSGIYFNVNAASGPVTGMTSNAFQSTNINSNTGVLAGGLNPTGWGAGT